LITSNPNNIENDEQWKKIDIKKEENESSKP